MSAVLLAVALMQPGDFTGRWAFTSFQTRPVQLRVHWGDGGIGYSKQTGLVWAARDADGPLVIESQEGRRCLRYFVTRTTPDHRHLWGTVEMRDGTCMTVQRRGTFRGHARRP